MKGKFLGLILMVVFLVNSCATPGKESFELGKSLERQNRIEEALSMYEEAVAKEPDNKEYKDALNRVRAQLVKAYLEKARAYANMKPTTFDNLMNAKNFIDKALKIDSANVEAEKLNSAVKTEIDKLTKMADALYLSASKAMETNDWVVAVKKFREIMTFYPNYLDLKIKLSTAESSGVNYYLREADKLKNLDEWDEVIRVLSHALEIQPGNKDIEARLKEAMTKHNPEYYISIAEDALKRGDWELALRFINKLKTLHQDSITAQRVKELNSRFSFYLIAKAEEDIANKRLYSAYTKLTTAITLMPNIRSDPRTTSAINQLINLITTEANTYESNGYIGNAYIWYEKAMKLTPENIEILRKGQALKDKIKQRATKKIAIMDFTAPSNSPDAGKVITDSLLAYLTKHVTSDIKILARDVLGAILKEIELGQAGLYDIESAKKAGKLKGTDVFIFGSVLRYSIEKNVDEGYKTVNVVVGKKTLPNPAYQMWLVAHPKAKEEELKNAPPPFIEEEVRETVKYKVGTHRKTASIQISFRVIDVEEGEVISTTKLGKKKTVEDTYSEGVEFANIPFKAVKLPSDTELMEQVMEEIVAELGQAVISRFQNLQVLYLNNAELLKKKGELIQAIEKYIDAIHIEELKNLSSPVSEKAKKEIEQILKTREI